MSMSYIINDIIFMWFNLEKKRICQAGILCLYLLFVIPGIMPNYYVWRPFVSRNHHDVE